MSEIIKKPDLPSMRRWKLVILDLSLALLGIVLLGSACYLLLGCRPRVINPSMEERIFFQSEVQCEIVRDQCRFFVKDLGPMEEFLIVGKGAYERDQEDLQTCEEQALIRKKDK